MENKIFSNFKKLNITNLTQYIFIGLLIVAAFLIGSLYTKVQYLEKDKTDVAGAVNQPNQPQPAGKWKTIDEALTAIGKEVGVDTKKLMECVNSGEKSKLVKDDLALAQTLGVQGTPAFFINGIFLGGAYPFEAFKEIIDHELNDTTSTDYNDYSELLKEAYPRSFNPERKEIAQGSSQSKGKDNASVTIIEFSDFQCPFCIRVIGTLSQILDVYQGKVSLVYKHLPLTSIHPWAQKTAEAAECAGDQNKFWDFHDKLFEYQQDWAQISS